MDHRKLLALAQANQRKAIERTVGNVPNVAKAVDRLDLETRRELEHARDVQRLTTGFRMLGSDEPELPESTKERITTEYSNSLGLLRR